MDKWTDFVLNALNVQLKGILSNNNHLFYQIPQNAWNLSLWMIKSHYPLNTLLKCQKSFHNKIRILSNQYHLKWLLLGLSTIPVTTTWCPVCNPDTGLKETPEVSTLKPLSQVTWCLLESFTTTTSASATTNGFTRICLSDVLSCLLDKNTILD